MSEFRFFAYTDFEFHTNRSENLLQLPITAFQPTRHTTTDEISHELNIPYTVFEILVAIFAVIGNLMVIVVFQRERKLRRRTNYYIVSLAMADFLVGSLGVPFAILASIGMPTNLYACLFTVSLLVVLCTISIFCLVAVSVDRYWAILYPMAYSRNVRTRTAIVIISLCWFAGAVVGFLPLFGWHAEVGPNQACLFVEVMDYNYLVFLYFATIITPALIMLAFYMHIYRVIVKQVQQIVTMDPVGDCSRRSSAAQMRITSPGRACHGGTMLRVLGAARKRDIKATQNLSIIVLFFMICWIPLYTINCIKAFCPACDVHPKLTLFCIILSHLNSAVNPVLYAYHLKDFRLALKNLILKIMGIEVAPRKDTAVHRFSVASQHRLQSLDASVRHSLQPRVYIDSPVWLRQQQQQQQTLRKGQTLPTCGGGAVGNTIGTIHKTVAAVASVPAEIERGMWNIMEASSAAELADKHYRKSSSAASGMNGKGAHPDRDDYGFTDDDDDDDGACDDVFLPSTTTGVMAENNIGPLLARESLSERLCLSENEFRQESFPANSSEEGSSASQSPKLLRSKSSSKICSKAVAEATTTNTLSSVYIIETSRVSPVTTRPRRGLTRGCVSDSGTPQREPPPRIADTNNISSTTSSSTLSMAATGNNHNNSHYENNLNYHTYHHHSSRPAQFALLQHRSRHPEKFSPLKVMTSFIFPPAVKHSSLFQLFQPSTISTPCSPARQTPTKTPTKTTTKETKTKTATKTATTTTLSPKLRIRSLNSNESTSRGATNLATDQQQEVSALSSTSS